MYTMSDIDNYAGVPSLETLDGNHAMSGFSWDSSPGALHIRLIFNPIHNHIGGDLTLQFDTHVPLSYRLGLWSRVLLSLSKVCLIVVKNVQCLLLKLQRCSFVHWMRLVSTHRQSR